MEEETLYFASTSRRCVRSPLFIAQPADPSLQRVWFNRTGEAVQFSLIFFFSEAHFTLPFSPAAVTISIFVFAVPRPYFYDHAFLG